MTRNLKLVYIGGGSKMWARVFMGDLAASEGLGGEISLYDIDPEAARLIIRRGPHPFKQKWNLLKETE